MKLKKYLPLFIGILYGIIINVVVFFLGITLLLDVLEFITPIKYQVIFDSFIYGGLIILAVISILSVGIASVILYFFNRKFDFKNIRQYYYGILLAAVINFIIIPLIFFLTFSGINVL